MSIDWEKLPKVIKACKAAGVESLKTQELEIHFKVGETPRNERRESEISIPPNVVGPEVQRELAEAIDLKAKVIEAEDELDHMLVENPALYEQLMVERELENAPGREPEEVAQYQ